MSNSAANTNAAVDASSRYDATGRVCTVFFSAITGWGLNRILQQEGTTGLGPDHWLYFGVAFLMVLRFLFGSANHFWLKTIKAGTKPLNSVSILWDLTCLLVLGVTALWVCYSNSRDAFLAGTFVFGLIAAGIAFINFFTKNDPSRQAAVVWFVINIFQSAASDIFRRSPFSLWGLVIIFFVLLLYDVGFQLRLVRKAEA
jgi:hypothetical protein